MSTTTGNNYEWFFVSFEITGDNDDTISVTLMFFVSFSCWLFPDDNDDTIENNDDIFFALHAFSCWFFLIKLFSSSGGNTHFSGSEHYSCFLDVDGENFHL